jgi:hypothetical protein
MRDSPAATGAITARPPLAAALDATSSPPPGSPLAPGPVEVNGLHVAPAPPEPDQTGEPLAEITDPPAEGE